MYTARLLAAINPRKLARARRLLLGASHRAGAAPRRNNTRRRWRRRPRRRCEHRRRCGRSHYPHGAAVAAVASGGARAALDWRVGKAKPAACSLSTAVAARAHALLRVATAPAIGARVEECRRWRRGWRRRPYRRRGRWLRRTPAHAAVGAIPANRANSILGAGAAIVAIVVARVVAVVKAYAARRDWRRRRWQWRWRRVHAGGAAWAAIFAVGACRTAHVLGS